MPLKSGNRDSLILQGPAKRDKDMSARFIHVLEPFKE